MASAKDIELRVIPSKVANSFVRRHHYSGKVATTSFLHFGAFLQGRLHGVMSFGNPMSKRKVLGLVDGTPWSGMLELNRMAFDDTLPRNSESRCLSVAFRLIKKNAPHVKWILSFADATECGDGTIYRAAGFVLTGIKKNSSTARLPDGTSITPVSFACTRSMPRPELGGGISSGILPHREPVFSRVFARGRRGDERRVSAKVYIFPRSNVARKTDGSRTSVLTDQRAGSRHVSRGKAMTRCWCNGSTWAVHVQGGGSIPTAPLHVRIYVNV